jgi:hypothetical protein
MSPIFGLSGRLQQLPLFTSEHSKRKTCRLCRGRFPHFKKQEEKIIEFWQFRSDCPGCDLLANILDTYKDLANNESIFISEGHFAQGATLYIRLGGGDRNDAVLCINRFPGTDCFIFFV